MRTVRHYVFFLFIICSTYAHAQFELVPLPGSGSSKQNGASRTKEAVPKKLPFWDDFSFAKGSSPVDSLWQFGKSVWLNNGIGVNPPSIGVVTFDGLDSLGKPYSVNDVLAKGFADQLVSQPLRLDLVDQAARATTYISFYYQLKGNGELPDAGDQLRLQLRDSTGAWETIWSVENNNTFQIDSFYTAIIPIPVDNERFFHDEFRFRFQNFARLSGPYDTWNLDYIYLNKGRSATDTSYPDRSLITPLGSLFTDYSSIPVKHFLKNIPGLIKHAEFTLYNLKDIATPVNYLNAIKVQNYVGDEIKTYEELLDSAEIAYKLSPQVRTTVQLETLPPENFFESDADSIAISVKLTINTKDNVPPEESGDYIAAQYAPLDFRWNDTTRTSYLLSNYYAYDDGTAEYGAGIKGFGVQVMYQYDMKSTESDTLIGLKIYFPRFGDESSQLIQLQVLRDLNGTVGSTLYEESVTVRRSAENKFIDYKFARFVSVPGSFYIGWKQSTASAISVGLDKNTDSSTKIFYNTSSSWQQDPNVKGSLMMRPLFGKGGPVTGLPESAPTTAIYPNPNNGTFFLSPQAQQIKVTDLTGREIYFTSEDTSEYKRLDLNGSPGIYIVRYLINGGLRTEKIMVLK